MSNTSLLTSSIKLNGNLNYYYYNFNNKNANRAACVKLVRASMVESSHDNSIKRMERAWLISKVLSVTFLICFFILLLFINLFFRA